MSTSCVSHKSLISFPEQEGVALSPEQIMNFSELRIQPEDLLKISVFSSDTDAVAPFNIEAPNTQVQNLQLGASTANILELFNGYFVDQNGNIDFPLAGAIRLEGLTLPQAKQKILEAVRPYVTDAVVNIRFLNFKVTILGEVNMPGTIRLSNKRVTLLEALGLAGDLSIYADRTNLLLIREKEGIRSYHRINLQRTDIFTSELFYLQQNDVVYISPLQSRVATVADPVTRVVSYVTAGLSIITLIVALGR